jgi:hypothetical protein
MWICEQQGINPEDGGVIRAFREEVKQGFRGEIKGPFNVEARETAGMTKDFYENLRGEFSEFVELSRTDFMEKSNGTKVDVPVAYETIN